MLSRYDGAIGLKTGFTKKTGRCLVSAAEREGLTLIAVTLSAPDDWNDHTKMLDYGFDAYERVTFFGVGEFTYPYSVCGGKETVVTLTNTEPLSLSLPKGAPRVEFSALHYSMEDMTKYKHRHELSPDGKTHLIVNYRVGGIGSNSCGPLPLPKDRLYEDPFRYAFTLDFDKI
jgi:D-alanyl-D-alanine carboxypeptidase